MEYEQKVRENNQLKKSITDIELKFSKLKNEYDTLKIQKSQTKQIDTTKPQEENIKLRSILALTYDSLESLSARVHKLKVNESQSFYQFIEDIKVKLHPYMGSNRELKENCEGSYLENAKLKEDLRKFQNENERLKVFY